MFSVLEVAFVSRTLLFITMLLVYILYSVNTNTRKQTANCTFVSYFYLNEAIYFLKIDKPIIITISLPNGNPV